MPTVGVLALLLPMHRKWRFSLQEALVQKKTNNWSITILGQGLPSILALGDLGTQHPGLYLRIKLSLLTLVGSTSKTISARAHLPQVLPYIELMQMVLLQK